MTAALRAAEILMKSLPQDAVQQAGPAARWLVPGRWPRRWPSSARGALVRPAFCWRCWAGGGQLCVSGGFQLGAWWVWYVSVLSAVPEVTLLWFVSGVTAGKYWIFDVCLAESFPSSVFCTTCICLIIACFPVTLSSLTMCCSPSTKKMMSLIHR